MHVSLAAISRKGGVLRLAGKVVGTGSGKACECVLHDIMSRQRAAVFDCLQTAETVKCDSILVRVWRGKPQL